MCACASRVFFLRLVLLLQRVLVRGRERPSGGVPEDRLGYHEPDLEHTLERSQWSCPVMNDGKKAKTWDGLVQHAHARGETWARGATRGESER